MTFVEAVIQGETPALVTEYIKKWANVDSTDRRRGVVLIPALRLRIAILL